MWFIKLSVNATPCWEPFERKKNEKRAILTLQFHAGNELSEFWRPFLDAAGRLSVSATFSSNLMNKKTLSILMWIFHESQLKNEIRYLPSKYWRSSAKITWKIKFWVYGIFVWRCIYYCRIISCAVETNTESWLHTEDQLYFILFYPIDIPRVY